MKCACGGKTTVIDKRARRDGIWRRRKCSACGERITTIEERATGRAGRYVLTPAEEARVKLRDALAAMGELLRVIDEGSES